ncbi:T9SS type A sorting domain-containing protein [Marinigracilibium pacificum]|uniref:T9SS type A sorting domain-containing protein n=1 Tax=Marinigracilibium pacificum TaxID=2729599 RepID=A0A848J425_9BACT|nr:T9SS type A sorting domain-containing protein [Marinigracilibium pacificum]NMM50481.1 T9SS type A sorting domain-containing protein [Marinigracilibium pacificum]
MRKKYFFNIVLSLITFFNLYSQDYPYSLTFKELTVNSECFGPSAIFGINLYVDGEIVFQQTQSLTDNVPFNLNVLKRGNTDNVIEVKLVLLTSAVLGCSSDNTIEFVDYIDLRELPPLQTNQGTVSTELVYISNTASITYNFFYQIPEPKVSLDGSQSNYCLNESLSIRNELLSPNYVGLGIKYIYNINGQTTKVPIDNPDYCGDEIKKCDPGYLEDIGQEPAACCSYPQTIYEDRIVYNEFKTIDLTQFYPQSGQLIKVNSQLIKDMFSDLGESISENAIITIKAELHGGTVGKRYEINVGTFMLSPQGPEFNITKLGDACADSLKGGGGIEVQVTKPTVNNTYVAWVLPDGQSLQLNASDTIGFIKSDIKTVELNGINENIINDLKLGNNTVYVTNGGGSRGFCYNPDQTQQVSIETVTSPEISYLSFDSVTCNSMQDASIDVGFTGGSWESYTYSFSKAGTLLHSEEVDLLGQYPIDTVQVWQCSWLVDPKTNMLYEDCGYSDSIIYEDYNRNFDIANLSGGTYDLLIQDKCGSKINNTINIFEPEDITSSASSVDLTCFNEKDGKINISSIQNGSFEYAVVLKNSLGNVIDSSYTQANSKLYESLDAGQYEYTIYDAKNPQCATVTEAFDLKPATPLTADIIDFDSVSCFGLADGFIEIQASGGSLDYKFEVTDLTAGNLFVSNDNSLISGLSGGDYRIILKNENNYCSDQTEVSPSFNIYEPAEISIALDIDSITCFGDDDARITASVSGGAENFSYNWLRTNAGVESPMGINNSEIQNLYAADYRLIVTDGNNCDKVSETITIINPSQLLFDQLEALPVSCFGFNDGSLNVLASGGWGGYNYQFKTANEPETAFKPLDSTLELPGGLYDVRVTDEGNCILQTQNSLEVKEASSALTFQRNLQDFNGFEIACAGENSGTIDYTVSGGQSGPSGEYTFKTAVLGTVQSTGSLAGLSAGQHIIEIIDQYNCTLKDTVLLSEPAPLVLASLETVDVKCFGIDNGEITFSVSGGVPSYNYMVNGENITPSNEIINKTGLGQGDHIIDVVDANSCLLSETITINSLNPPIETNITALDISCFNANDGQINITSNGGVSPYTYSVNGNVLPGSMIDGLTAGEYIILLEDAEGCIKYDTVSLSEPSNIDVIDFVKLCKDQQLTLDPIAFDPAATYTWTLPDGSIVSGSEVLLSEAGEYFIKVDQSADCILYDTVSVETSELDFKVNFLMASKISTEDSLVIVDISNPKPDSINWYLPQGIEVIEDNGDNLILAPSAVGEYWLRFTAFAEGCFGERIKYFTVLTPEELATEEGRYVLGEMGLKVLKVYPNPVNTILKIEGESYQEDFLNLRLYDLNGTNIQNFNQQVSGVFAREIDLSTLEPDIYFLIIETKTDQIAIKVIKE